MAQAPLNVGLIGLGVVGSQVAERLLTWGPQLARRAGVEICLRRVLVRDVNKRRSVEIGPDLLTADPAALLEDPAIDVLVEVAGGDEPMRGYLEKAITAGKHVVTANKVVMAKHGPELLDCAGASGAGSSPEAISRINSWLNRSARNASSAAAMPPGECGKLASNARTIWSWLLASPIHCQTTAPMPSALK